jgi:hypothetical protein
LTQLPSQNQRVPFEMNSNRVSGSLFVGYVRWLVQEDDERTNHFSGKFLDALDDVFLGATVQVLRAQWRRIQGIEQLAQFAKPQLDDATARRQLVAGVLVGPSMIVRHSIGLRTVIRAPPMMRAMILVLIFHAC